MPIQHINPENLAVSPNYTQVVAVGKEKHTVYISGQLALDQSGKVVGKADFARQTRQVYENLKTALDSVGATFDSLVKTSIYIVDSDAEKSQLFRAIRSQYQTGPHPPASTLIGVQSLAIEGCMIEIE